MINTYRDGWTKSQLYRRAMAAKGRAVVANLSRDKPLITWAKENGIYLPVDRSSPWGNPFRLFKETERDYVCETYALYLQKRKDLLAQLPKLKGRVLCCHCHPKQCHADLLAKLANDL